MYLEVMIQWGQKATSSIVMEQLELRKWNNELSLLCYSLSLLQMNKWTIESSKHTR